MGGELGGLGGEAPGLGHGVQRGSGGRSPQLTSARHTRGVRGLAPQFGKLG